MAKTFGSLFVLFCIFATTNPLVAQCVQTNGPYGGFVASFAVSPNGAGRTSLYAGTESGGVFRSSDNGARWAAASNGLTNSDVRSLAVSGANLSAETFGGGAFRSTNNGTTWTAVNNGFGEPLVVSLAVSGTNLFVGTFGNSVWRRPLSEVIASVESGPADLPARFSLDQNYPNLFNPITIIKFQIPSTKSEFGISDLVFVSLKVYDMLGREVATLVNGVQTAGQHDVRFEATNFPSGVYFYRLQTGTLTESRRMVLLK